LVLTDAGVILLAVCLGLIFGSFLNVVIHRMPLGRSVAGGRSYCPHCDMMIRWFDNIPVASWLLLRGRCRGCRAPISIRYPLVEAFSAVLVFGLAWRFALRPEEADWGRCLVGVPFVLALLAVSLIDLRHTIIPDKITVRGMILAPIASLLVPTLHRTDLLPGIADPAAAALLSLAGILTGAASIWIIGQLGRIVFKKEAMGFGDVKLMGLIGGFVGPIGVILAIPLACLFGAVFGISALIVSKFRPSGAERRVAWRLAKLREDGEAGLAPSAPGAREDFEEAAGKLDGAGTGTLAGLLRESLPERSRPEVGEEPDGRPAKARKAGATELLEQVWTEMDRRAGETVDEKGKTPSKTETTLRALDAATLDDLARVLTGALYIPFGPWLSLGAALVYAFRPEIVHFFTDTWPNLIS
jgi:leader peptidase (prepilin peptidase)/N-methyltransferase